MLFSTKNIGNFFQKFIIFIVFLSIIVTIFLKVEYKRILIIKNQKTDEVYLKKIVYPNDILIFEWIHSFEHIPWNEEFEILDDNSLRLNKIIVAGFGAGIPENKGDTSVDNKGNINMDNINEIFEGIYWINSVTALQNILINDKIIIRGKDLPHHKSIALIIERRLKICPLKL